jgi:AcrR family transcriptional regulator
MLNYNEFMPYSKEHKEATRQKILDSAIHLFSRHGFDQISIDDLMADAGLTRGAFYTHFKNKKAIYSKAIIAGAKKSRIMHQKPPQLSNEEWTVDLLSGYLSKAHINQEMSPCPLAFLVTDIANSEDEVQETYTRMYKILNKTIQAHLKDSAACNEQDILAATAMMIGGVAIGRALSDETMTEKLLDSCQKASLSLLNLNHKLDEN